MSNIVDVSHISVFYNENKKEKEFRGCKDVSFSIKKGQTVGLLGESGSGKSTVAKAILGLQKLSEGTVTHYTKKPQMIFQDPKNSLNPSMKVARIMEEPLRIQKKYKKEERVRMVEEMMELVGLDVSLKNHYPDALSGGQRQRVSIGTALISGSKFLVADEAVSALDMTIQAKIIDLLKKIKENMDLSILFISHDLKLVYNMCDYVLVMRDGIVVEEGITKDVFKNPQTVYMKELIDVERQIIVK